MCSTDGGQDNNNEEAPENNPSYTTVYVGNLPHDVSYMNWKNEILQCESFNFFFIHKDENIFMY